MVHDQEGEEDDGGADPVQAAGVLALENDLSDERERNGQAEADGDNEGRGQEHGVGPADV